MFLLNFFSSIVRAAGSMPGHALSILAIDSQGVHLGSEIPTCYKRRPDWSQATSTGSGPRGRVRDYIWTFDESLVVLSVSTPLFCSLLTIATITGWEIATCMFSKNYHRNTLQFAAHENNISDSKRSGSSNPQQSIRVRRLVQSSGWAHNVVAHVLEFCSVASYRLQPSSVPAQRIICENRLPSQYPLPGECHIPFQQLLTPVIKFELKIKPRNCNSVEGFQIPS